jgi:hypothetical protein
MFGSEILDVALGMVFVFLLLSLIASGIREAFEAWFKSRAVFLERGIREMLADKNGTGLACMLYNHPHISSLFKDGYQAEAVRRRGGTMPTYMPSHSFAVALIDIVTRGPVVEKQLSEQQREEQPARDATTQMLVAALNNVQVFRKRPELASNTDGITVAQLRAGLGNLASERLRRVFVLAMDNAGDDLDKVHANVEAWFNETMDRVSGWYRRRTQMWLYIIAAVMVVSLNLDTVAIADHLWTSKSAREQLTARAEAFASNPSNLMLTPGDTAQASATLTRQMEELRALNFPIGWERPVGSVPVKLFGLIITVFAIALGASFWFDALKRIMVIRSTIKGSAATPTDKGEVVQGASGRG